MQEALFQQAKINMEKNNRFMNPNSGCFYIDLNQR